MQVDEIDDAACIARLNLPTTKAPQVSDALRAAAGQPRSALSHQQLVDAAEAFRSMGPAAWKQCVGVGRGLPQPRPWLNDLSDWPVAALRFLNAALCGSKLTLAPPRACYCMARRALAHAVRYIAKRGRQQWAPTEQERQWKERMGTARWSQIGWEPRDTPHHS